MSNKFIKNISLALWGILFWTYSSSAQTYPDYIGSGNPTAASGVGTAAIQIAKSIGAKVIVTASKGKHDLCKSLSADWCIDYDP